MAAHVPSTVYMTVKEDDCLQYSHFAPKGLSLLVVCVCKFVRAWVRSCVCVYMYMCVNSDRMNFKYELF